MLTTRRLTAFAVVALLGAALFPFRKQMSELAFQLVLLPLTAVYVQCLFMFFGGRADHSGGPDRLLGRIDPRRVSLTISLVLLLACTGMMLYENRLFSQFGYGVPATLALGALACLSALTAVMTLRWEGRHLGYALLASVVVFQLLSIGSFPLHHGRSDMLLLIQEASARFLSGQSPYGSYVIHEWVMLTYLPGMWLPYVPAVLLGIDVRVVNVVCLMLSLTILMRMARHMDWRSRLGLMTLAAVFFLNPWLLFRHETYLAVFFLPLFASFALLLRGRLWASVAVFAWSLCSYQLAWVVAPLFLLMLLRRYGCRTALGALGVFAAFAAVMLGPFLAWDAGTLLRGVFGTWSDVLQIETLNLSWWMLRVVPLQAMKLVQAGLLIVLYVLAVRGSRSPASFLRWSALATALFIMTSQLIWHYFFLLPPVYMLWHHFAECPPASPRESG